MGMGTGQGWRASLARGRHGSHRVKSICISLAFNSLPLSYTGVTFPLVRVTFPLVRVTFPLVRVTFPLVLVTFPLVRSHGRHSLVLNPQATGPGAGSGRSAWGRLDCLGPGMLGSLGAAEGGVDEELVGDEGEGDAVLLQPRPRRPAILKV